MSKYGIYGIKDIKQGFRTPIYQRNDAVILREFASLVNAKEKNYINEYPEDMELWKLGVFDEELGTIEAESKFLAKAIDFKEEL